MRRKFLGVATLFALLAFVAVAIGEEVGPGAGGEYQSLEVTHKPSKPKKGTKVSVTVEERVADPAVTPSLQTESDVSLPKGMKLGYKDFPTCNPDNLVQPVDETKPPTGCTRKSMVGKGKGIADARPLLGADAAPITAPVFAFNGKKQGGKPTYILWANSPIDPDITLVGKLVGRVLKIPIPQGNPLCGGATGDPNICAGIIHFDVTQGATITKKRHGKKVKVPYLTNPSKCPSGGYEWDIKFTYKNGDTLDPHDKVSC